MQQRDDGAAPRAHLTEGELHTFLDGQVAVFGPARAREIRAHVEDCAHCRDRLAVESSVRDRASAILGSETGPATIELPSLAEMQAVAGHGAGSAPLPGRGRLERRVRWGWAATVVLSLGVGYGVGAWGPGVGVPSAEEAVPSAGAVEAVQDAASQEADQPVSPPEPLPRRTVEEPVPPAERVAPIREREQLTVPSSDLVAAGAELAPGSLVAQPRVLGDVAERLAAGNAARMSTEEPARPAQMLRSDVGDASTAILGSPAPPSPDAPNLGEADVDVSLVLEGMSIETLRWMEVWPGQQGLVSIQRFGDGRRVELRIAGPAVGDSGPVTPPPGDRTDPVEGWARVIGPLGAGWVALDGPLSAKELAQLLATIR